MIGFYVSGSGECRRRADDWGLYEWIGRIDGELLTLCFILVDQENGGWCG